MEGVTVTRLYKIGTRVRIIRIDPGLDRVWRVGDTGVIVEHNVWCDGMRLDYSIKMDRPKGVCTHAAGNHSYVIPVTKPPLLDRIRRLFKKPSIDLTPGFSWEDMGWHPKDFIPKEDTEKER